MNILAISGSLRKGSFNSALLRAVAERAPEGMTITLAEIGNLPLYNQDLEVGFPKEAADLKAAIRAADGIIIATPEFNRSVPGALKNALDWTSRPYGDSAWEGKSVYVMSASTGNISAALANYALKQILLYLNTRLLGQPEFFLGIAQDKFDADGKLIDEKTGEYIDRALIAFRAFIGG